RWARWRVRIPQRWWFGARFDPTLEFFNSFGADPRDNFDALLFVEPPTTSRGLEHPPRVAALSPASVKDSNAEPTNFAFIKRAATPDGWRLTDNSLYPYAVAITDRASPDGGRAVCISRAGSPLPWGDAALTQRVPAAPWRGRRLVSSAAMRAEAPRIGTGATLLVHVWPKQAPIEDHPEPDPGDAGRWTGTFGGLGPAVGRRRRTPGRRARADQHCSHRRRRRLVRGPCARVPPGPGAKLDRPTAPPHPAPSPHPPPPPS